MNVSISNLAWSPQWDERVADILSDNGVSIIDICPMKYFEDPLHVSIGKIEKLARAWTSRGIRIEGFQGLLFNHPSLQIFDPSVAQAMKAHFEALGKIAALLGVSKMVFGSPRNRRKGALEQDVAIEQAAGVFRSLGDILATEGVTLTLEVNPGVYGGDFMLTYEETVRVVRATDHEHVKLQLDTGALKITQEPLRKTLNGCLDLIGHVHASEPGLVAVGTGGVDHRAHAAWFSDKIPGKTVCVEMLPCKDEDPLVGIQSVLAFVNDVYGGEEG